MHIMLIVVGHDLIIQYIQDEAFAQDTPKVYPLFEKNGQKLAYENIIDKYHMFASDITLHSTKAQPQIHFGIEPVQANAPTDTTPNFVNASAEYEIQCSCVIGFSNNLIKASL
ncbi:hypothetical protein QE152_g31193 [Popillia japonica]|uniref:Uncharacterized protein n=1 Tax=Popillia japonica TaxID=7064 RepID=A0AAW1JBW1_POPJA